MLSDFDFYKHKLCLCFGFSYAVEFGKSYKSDVEVGTARVNKYQLY